MQVGETVNLVRRITGEVLPVTLILVLVKSANPAVEVQWKSTRHRYKLDLKTNEVLAIDATPNHRQTMRTWYTISEGHLKALTDLYWSERKTRGRK